MPHDIDQMLKRYKSGRMPIERALDILKDLPYKDLGFAKIDNHRCLRRGFPEVVYGKGKTAGEIVDIAKKIMERDGILLITRTTPAVWKRIKRLYPRASFEKRAGLISYRRHPAVLKKGTVLIVTAGTADIPVAEEAKATLKLMGNRTEVLCDVGVAGIHRVLGNKAKLEKANVIIVVAGMEGALASVVSGMVSRPVIAVPTSVGYGASFEGIAPLLAMMNSCSPGVAVVNIDNGFGAAYFASMINA